MSSSFAIGDAVVTPLGKGVVLALRRHGRLLVEVKGRPIELEGAAVTAVVDVTPKAKRRRSEEPVESKPVELGAHAARPVEVDLHGLTVEEALGTVERVLNEAALSDRGEIRFIHGRSGGRIRGALHQRLRALSVVATFHLDPRNPGVTIVVL